MEISGCKGISFQNMAWKMVLTYLQKRDPGDLPWIKSIFHRIGWWENLQESPINLMVKTMVYCRFSLKPSHWILIHATCYLLDDPNDIDGASQESLGPDGRPDGRTKKGGSIEAHPSGEKGNLGSSQLGFWWKKTRYFLRVWRDVDDLMTAVMAIYQL